jgi:hypothetical protein
MTDRIDDDTDLTHAVRFYPLSLLTESGDQDNALIVSWQNQAASPNAAHAARMEGASEVGIIMFDKPIEGWPKSPVLWFLVQGEPKLMRRQSDPVLSEEQTTTLLAALSKFLDQEGLKPLHPTETLH